MADLIVWINDTDSGALIERISPDGERRHWIRCLETGDEASPEAMMGMTGPWDEGWPGNLPMDEAFQLLEDYETLCEGSA